MSFSFRLPWSRRQLLMLAAFFVSLWVPWLLSAVGLFLSLWIVLPAPTLWLLPLGVGAPEVSVWLLGVNAIAALVSLPHFSKSWFGVTLGMSLLGLGFSALPLVQVPTAQRVMNQTMQAALGADYLNQIPDRWRGKLRSQPFVLMDALRGIPGQVAGRSVRVTPDIPFATIDQTTLRLNLYRPEQPGLHPTIVVIYGGAWQNGTPSNDETFSRYMAGQGYTVVAIDYRHAPRYRFPTQFEDVTTALKFIRQHALEYEIDLTRFVLMGRSAGAHLAMLAGYRWAIDHPDAPPLRAVVNYYGPVDLTEGYYDVPQPDPIDTRAVLRAFLGGTPKELPELYRQASPYHQVTPNLPPTLLVYAGRDHLVQAKFGRKLYDRVRSLDNRAVFLEIPWAEHAFDAVFSGVSNQLALYYTERFLGWAVFRAL